MSEKRIETRIASQSFDSDTNASYLSVVLECITQAKSELAGTEKPSQSQKKRRERAEAELKRLLQTLGELSRVAILSFLDAPPSSVDLLMALLEETKDAAPLSHEMMTNRSKPITNSEYQLLKFTSEWHEGKYIVFEELFSARLLRTFCAELESIGTDKAMELRAVFRLLTAQTLRRTLENMKYGQQWETESNPLTVAGAKNLQGVRLGGAAVRENGRMQAEAIQAVSDEILNTDGFKGIENHCDKIRNFFKKHPERIADCKKTTDCYGNDKGVPSRSTVRRAIKGRIPSKPKP